MKKFLIFALTICMLNFLPAKAEEIEDVYIDSYVLPSDHMIKLVGAYMRIQDYFDKFEVEPNVIFHFSPSTNQSLLSSMKKNYIDAAKFFGIETSNVVYFNENETSWYQSKMLSLEGWHDNNWLVNFCKVSSYEFCGMASDRSSSPHYYHMVGSNLKNIRTDEDWVAHHETVHGFQTKIGFMKGETRLSCWIIEAQANVLSFASYIENNEIDEIRNNAVKKIYDIMPNIKSMNSDEFAKEFINLENNRNLCTKKGTGYYLGMAIVEYMYINFKIETVHDMFKDMSSGYSFDSASQFHFNMNKTEFYKKAFVYILESLNEIP